MRSSKLGLQPVQRSMSSLYSNFGMALPDKKTEISAGATLNAVVSTRIAEKQLPEFTSWKVQAERVEPRLVAITQPNSTYCEEYRSLRTHVLTKSQKQKLQAIVVASVGSGRREKRHRAKSFVAFGAD